VLVVGPAALVHPFNWKKASMAVALCDASEVAAPSSASTSRPASTTPIP
jgi:hypothetical protein